MDRKIEKLDTERVQMKTKVGNLLSSGLLYKTKARIELKMLDTVLVAGKPTPYSLLPKWFLYLLHWNSSA